MPMPRGMCVLRAVGWSFSSLSLMLFETETISLHFYAARRPTRMVAAMDSLHLKKLNPNISLAGTTFSIPTERQPWPAGMRRLAGVSSFGFGGTNAHMILEASPALSHKTNDIERSLHLFTLSAQSETALQTLAGRYEVFLTANPEVSVADMCFSINTGRSHFGHRRAFPVRSSTRLYKQLADLAGVRTNEGVHC